MARIRSQGGKRYAQGTCYFNRDSEDDPTQCAFPAPPLSGHCAAIWQLFHYSRSSANMVGMDAVPIGMSAADVRAIADGLDIGWNHVTVRRFSLVEQAWLKFEWQRREAAKK